MIRVSDLMARPPRPDVCTWPEGCDRRPETRRDLCARHYTHAAINERRWATAGMRAMTQDRYWAMFEAQAGLCLMCDSPPEHGGPRRRRRLVVDHDHETGEVRALLCSPCNLRRG